MNIIKKKAIQLYELFSLRDKKHTQCNGGISQQERIEIKRLCQIYKIRNYSIRDNGLVDVNGSVDISRNALTGLPIKFGIVTGNFHCTHNWLNTFEGFPISVGGIFNVGFNSFTTLQGCPILNENHSSISNFFSINHNNFPIILERKLLFLYDPNDSIILEKRKQLNIFVKYQDLYEVWDNGFNEDNFNLLMDDIENGLR